ncbi:MAG TPA: hypothetical protein DDY88_06490, partial [Actinobacteria bacterium]|nr:hypothetical protein [Actinomycetota bacterium]
MLAYGEAMNANFEVAGNRLQPSLERGRWRQHFVRAIASAAALATVAAGALTLAPVANAATTITFQPSGGTVGFGIPLKAAVA